MPPQASRRAACRSACSLPDLLDNLPPDYVNGLWAALECTDQRALRATTKHLRRMADSCVRCLKLIIKPGYNGLCFIRLVNSFTNLKRLEIDTVDDDIKLPNPSLSSLLLKAKAGLNRVPGVILQRLGHLGIDFVCTLALVFKSLQTLELHFSDAIVADAVSGLFLAPLEECNQLHCLTISTHAGLPDDSFRSVQRLRTLSLLQVRAQQLPHDALVCLSVLSRLQDLSLQCDRGDTTDFYSHLHHLRGLHQLTSLQLNMGSPSGHSTAPVASLKQLSVLTQLQRLQLLPSLGTTLGFQAVKQMPAVTTLDVGVLRTAKLSRLGGPPVLEVTKAVAPQELLELFPIVHDSLGLRVYIDLALPPGATATTAAAGASSGAMGGRSSSHHQGMSGWLRGVARHLVGLPLVSLSLGPSSPNLPYAPLCEVVRALGTLPSVKVCQLRHMAVSDFDLAALSVAFPRVHTVALLNCCGATGSAAAALRALGYKLGLVRSRGISKEFLLAWAMARPPGSEFRIVFDSLSDGDVARFNDTMDALGRPEIKFHQHVDNLL